VTTLQVVVPDAIDDPRRPSGGNRYDRRVCAELEAMGWTVVMHPAAGAWPHAGAADRAALEALLDAIPDAAVVLIDGLVASAVDDVLLRHAPRLRYVVLLHMPLGEDAPAEVRRSEGAVLSAAAAVVVTSAWSRSCVTRLYDLPEERIAVAEPGVDPAAPAAGSESGGELLCVATVTHAKGHDLLLEALASIPDLQWSCTCAGSPHRDPAFAHRVRSAAKEGGLSGRLRFAGACSDAELERLFHSADVLVHPSRAETYGMVVAEALAHGLPVIASEVGGVPEALGRASSGPPGVLVPPGDAAALAAALRTWLEDSAVRQRLRTAAAERRERLRPWSETASEIAGVCEAAGR
jgi:glycosyltransferase involved in cell wall biosynthesis